MGLTSRPSDYIKTPSEKNRDSLFKSLEPLEMTISSWDEFQVLNFSENLDAQDIKKTVKFMYGLLQNKKYDDKKIASEHIFMVDDITVNEVTKEEKLKNMKIEAIKEKHSDKAKNHVNKDV